MKNITNTFPVLIDANPEAVFAYLSDIKAHTDLASDRSFGNEYMHGGAQQRKSKTS